MTIEIALVISVIVICITVLGWRLIEVLVSDCLFARFKEARNYVSEASALAKEIKEVQVITEKLTEDFGCMYNSIFKEYERLGENKNA